MKKSGFTLLEILVVLSILALLVGIAVPRMKGMQDQAKVQKAKSDLRTLKAAVESYYLNHRRVYPNTSTEIGADLVNDVPKMLATNPYDPWGATATTNYTYTLYGTFNAGYFYVIRSPGTSAAGTATLNSATGVVSKDTGVLCVTNGSGC